MGVFYEPTACNEITGFLTFSYGMVYMADSSFAPSQWETALLCNDVSHWLGANLKSAVVYIDGLV